MKDIKEDKEVQLAIKAIKAQANPQKYPEIADLKQQVIEKLEVPFEKKALEARLVMAMMRVLNTKLIDQSRTLSDPRQELEDYMEGYVYSSAVLDQLGIKPQNTSKAFVHMFGIMQIIPREKYQLKNNIARKIQNFGEAISMSNKGDRTKFNGDLDIEALSSVTVNDLMNLAMNGSEPIKYKVIRAVEKVQQHLNQNSDRKSPTTRIANRIIEDFQDFQVAALSVSSTVNNYRASKKYAKEFIADCVNDMAPELENRGLAPAM